MGRILILTLAAVIAALGCAVDSGGGGGAENSTASDSITVNQSFADDSFAAAPAVSIVASSGLRVSVDVELAASPAQQEQGLSGRDSLGEFSGMLFIFSRAGFYSFTLANTFFPLDILYIDQNQRIIGIISNAPARTDGPYFIAEPAMFVLEVNGGFADRNGIREGNQVDFDNFDIEPLILENAEGQLLPDAQEPDSGGSANLDIVPAGTAMETSGLP